MKQVRTRWTVEETEFLTKWYGAIKTSEISRILQKGDIKLMNNKATKSKIKKNDKVFGTIEVVYKKEVHTAQGFTYMKKGKSSIKMTLDRKRAYKTRNSREEQRIEAALREERKSRYQLQVDSNNERITIPPFVAPQGKVLTLVCQQPRTYKYL